MSNTDITNMTPEELSKWRDSIDPNSMGFNDDEKEGVADEHK